MVGMCICMHVCAKSWWNKNLGVRPNLLSSYPFNLDLIILHMCTLFSQLQNVEYLYSRKQFENSSTMQL